MPILTPDPEQNPSCHNSTRAGALPPCIRRGDETREAVGQGRGGEENVGVISQLTGCPARPTAGARLRRQASPAGRAGQRAADQGPGPYRDTGEAEDGLQLMLDLECAWFAARAAVAGRCRNSRAAAAVDILAASPLVSATSLAAGFGRAVNNAAALLDAFCATGIAVEVTHRSERRCSGWRPSRRSGFRPGRRPGDGTAAAAAANPNRAACVRLQRHRALDDAAGPDDPAHATRARRIGARAASAAGVCSG
jgi:hypothetical protein